MVQLAKLNFKYGLDEIPPPVELILYSLQWLAISIPTIIIIGKVVAGLYFGNAADQIVYVQKVFFITAVAMLAQLLWGHKLPLILGPAAVLLVGIVASQGNNPAAVYTSIMLGGVILSIVSVTGLFGRLQKYFTPRVVATILILIAFTIAPTIMNLILSPSLESPPLFNLVFALVLVLIMFLAGRHLTGIWKSTLIIWAIIAGSIIYLLFFPEMAGSGGVPVFSASFFSNINSSLEFHPGIMFSFIVCFLALSINDLGSIQSVGELIKPDNMHGRITRGIALTGLANVLSGFLSVIGPVNFSLSPGIIMSTGNASRFTLMPTAAGLLILSFLPGAVAFVEAIPSLIIGTVMIYVMCSQIAAGMLVAFGSTEGFNFDSGLIMGLPLLLGIIISFLPENVLGTFSAALRPVIGNGFVTGVLAVLVLEHIIYRKK
ncbi:uracil-xanthine permease family protein [Desulfotruncus alcoholivorax]|uniref:uracil-xanthine permease family protein n=1 Tax=Desulfotruncus alcoholivorax TaxID=265477 RepID=UPI00041F6D00|nr:solute carrier family 23 protein [Desulfotruncus alcoholivorax]